VLFVFYCDLFYKYDVIGRIVEDTQEDTCRKKLCGEHVKLVKNRRVDRDEPLIDMCEQCKLNYEPTPLTDAGGRCF